MKFTASQQAAITRLGQDVCVIAGPGSGKTRVLTERFAWLVEKQGVAPQGILAITFTEKAAAEIRRRVQKRLPHPEVRQAPISTLHAFCLRILKEFAIPAGLDPGVALWDERVSSAQLYAAVEEVLNEAAIQEKDALRRLFTTWSVADPSQELSGLYKKIWALTDRIPSAAPLPSATAVLFRLQDLGRIWLVPRLLRTPRVPSCRSSGTGLRSFERKRIGAPTRIWRPARSAVRCPRP